MHNPHITRIEFGVLKGERPRAAGCNARLGSHGKAVSAPIVRISTDTGHTGFGWSRAPRDLARALLGRPFHHIFDFFDGPGSRWQPFEYPFWDLAGQLCEEPVYALAARGAGSDPGSLDRETTAPCYDTSLYFDDLDAASVDEAVDCLVSEAREGWDRGHRAFKLKIGRGAFHLPPEEGMERDVAIIRAVRDAVGPDAPLLLDANNGLNLNLTRRLLEQTAECNIFWLEEPFHEDPVLYRELRRWMQSRGLNIRIADGEGEASRWLLDWAREGVVDVLQYDIYHPGFTRWLAIGKQLDEWGRSSAPHQYGGGYGNYAACHLVSAVDGFLFAEWDEVTIEGLDCSGYSLVNGRVHLPTTPGFGLRLDDDRFRYAVADGGYDVAL